MGRALPTVSGESIPPEASADPVRESACLGWGRMSPSSGQVQRGVMRFRKLYHHQVCCISEGRVFPVAGEVSGRARREVLLIQGL